ncbi:MAG: polyhydroxyalkanoic acid system family protein [Proteobacteria bacterium]|nr:polyhydroxyalkanoic acid system family protein [Pseudomonadota bacterium]
MQLTLPHSLGVAEACRRLHERAPEIADLVPGFARVTTDWPSETRMAMTVSSLGKSLSGTVDVAEDHVVFTLDIPAALAFARPLIESALNEKGRKLLQ